MNQGVINGLNRRFEAAEKNAHPETHTLAFVEYFSFIIKNPLLQKTARIILEEGGRLSNDIIPYIIFASTLHNDFSLMVRTPQMKSYVEEILNGMEMERQGKLQTASLQKLEIESRQKISELERENLRYGLSVLHNELVERISGEHTKITLTFSRTQGLCLGSNSIKCYRPKGASNRLDYLERIIKKNGESISAKILTRGLNSGINTRIVVSSEVKEMNKIIMDKLNLKNKVILGNDGYKLNVTDYEFLLS